MKEHTQKNARIPPAALCSDAPSLSGEPPPLEADSGFTAFHTAPVAFGGVPGCLGSDCARLGCYLVRTEDVGPGICDDGCAAAIRSNIGRALVCRCNLIRSHTMTEVSDNRWGRP